MYLAPIISALDVGCRASVCACEECLYGWVCIHECGDWLLSFLIAFCVLYWDRISHLNTEFASLAILLSHLASGLSHICLWSTGITAGVMTSQCVHWCWWSSPHTFSACALPQKPPPQLCNSRKHLFSHYVTLADLQLCRVFLLLCFFACLLASFSYFTLFFFYTWQYLLLTDALSSSYTSPPTKKKKKS